MNVVRFAWVYLFWHYSRALLNLVTIWKNFLWFVYHFFSIPTLFRTLFAPWRRLGEAYGGGFDIEEFATVIIVNTLMRFVGAMARLFMIMIGLIGLAFVFVVGVIFGVVWLLMPLVLVVLFTIATTRLF